MTNTIAENEYQDCVQELTKTLRDERKLSSDKNKRIIEIEEQIGQAIAFIAAFEEFMNTEFKYACKEIYKANNDMSAAYLLAANEVISCYNALKAKHLEMEKT